jgi:tetratricopeptide (TPR) repeat protein
MAGNRRLFENALRRANKFFEEKALDKALAEYQAALQEFPDDLGTLDKVADLYERLGQLDMAALTYANTAGLKSRQGLRDEAIDYWQRAARLDNNNLEVHRNLAYAYLTQDKPKQAVREQLAMARIYQLQNLPEEALQAVQTAYKLDPTHPDVLAALELLRAVGIEEAEEAEQADRADGETGEVEDQRGSPVDIAREKAMSDLAESLFEEMPIAARVTPLLSKAEVDSLISQALDQQTAGDTDDAIATYKKIISSGVQMPAVNFNLGLLYQENVRLDEALEQFKQSVNHTEYRLGSLFALGELHRAKGHMDEALGYFLEALKIVDLQTVGREQADDLIQVYESLAETYAAKGEAQQAGNFVNSLVEFLSSKGWEDKVVQARNRLDNLTEDGAPAMSLAEILAERNGEQLLQSMSLMHELARRGKYYSAFEEAYIALQRSPEFLPLHIRLAEVIWKSGQEQSAITKFLTVANTLYTRGDARQAMSIYQRVLRLAPMDVSIRTKLIDLLVAYGEIDKAIEQYLALADVYYQLASHEKAREKYLEAQQLAPRGTTSRLWTTQISHKIGEMDAQRGDWKRAVQTYEQIRRYDPGDEKAQLALIELYYQVDPQRAVREIDDLIKDYRASKSLRKLAPIVEEQARLHPQDMALTARAAQVCLESGLKAKGIEYLNQLGEMQLNAGLTKQAIATIRAIVAMNPPNVNDYRTLLTQIGG